MYSIRNAVICLVGVMAAGGCQWVTPPPTARVNDTPIVVDEAMEHRDWSATTAYYANGVTVAGPTGQYFEPDQRIPEELRWPIEYPLFVGQVAALPFDFLWNPPWEDVAYPGVSVPPSYTAVPPTNVQY